MISSLLFLSSTFILASATYAQPASIPAGAPRDRDSWQITEMNPSATVLPANPQGLVQITVKMSTIPRRFAAVTSPLNPVNRTETTTIAGSASNYNVTSVDLNFCEDRTLFRKSCEIKLPESLLERPANGRVEFKIVGGPNLGTVQEACITQQTVTYNSFGGWGSRATTAEFVSDTFEPAGENEMSFVTAPYECERHYAPYDGELSAETLANRISDCRRRVSEDLQNNSLSVNMLGVRGIPAGTPCNSQLLTTP
jgi:hypothetical protein